MMDCCGMPMAAWPGGGLVCVRCQAKVGVPWTRDRNPFARCVENPVMEDVAVVVEEPEWLLFRSPWNNRSHLDSGVWALGRVVRSEQQAVQSVLRGVGLGDRGGSVQRRGAGSDVDASDVGVRLADCRDVDPDERQGDHGHDEQRVARD
jgi:hypothetical protein